VESIGGGCDWGIGGLRGVEPGARGGSLIRGPSFRGIDWLGSICGGRAGKSLRLEAAERGHGGVGRWVSGLLGGPGNFLFCRKVMKGYLIDFNLANVSDLFFLLDAYCTFYACFLYYVMLIESEILSLCFLVFACRISTRSS